MQLHRALAQGCLHLGPQTSESKHVQFAEQTWMILGTELCFVTKLGITSSQTRNVFPLAGVLCSQFFFFFFKFQNRIFSPSPVGIAENGMTSVTFLYTDNATCSWFVVQRSVASWEGDLVDELGNRCCPLLAGAARDSYAGVTFEPVRGCRHSGHTM